MLVHCNIPKAVYKALLITLEENSKKVSITILPAVSKNHQIVNCKVVDINQGLTL